MTGLTKAEKHAFKKALRVKAIVSALDFLMMHKLLRVVARQELRRWLHELHRDVWVRP